MTNPIIYYRHNKEFFISPEKILFYEASDDSTYAHTRRHIYRVRFRLYELEAFLPPFFLRISKSAIVNTNAILSLTTKIGTTGSVEFGGTLKRLHISRRYLKPLRSALSKRSNNYVNY